MLEITNLDMILRMLTAMVIGLIVGSERARAAHPAGARTHMLVALGASIVMIAGCMLSMETQAAWGTVPDPARMGAQVISGIGFLGAGTIIKDGFSVRGLTTAASLWSVACLGLAAGMGYYKLALLGALAIFITLVALDEFRQILYYGKRPELDLQIECAHMSEVLITIETLADRYFAVLADLSFDRTKHDTYIISFRVNFPSKDHEFAQTEFRQALAKVPGIISMGTRGDVL